ncbi:IS66 family transposase, partial [Lactobacillus reuteri]
MTPAEKENQELKARLKKALERNEELEEMVRQLQRMIFGKKTEKFETVVKGQGSLFDDEQLAALVDSDIDLTETEVTEIEVIEKKKVVRHQERKNSQGRAAFLDSLP